MKAIVYRQVRLTRCPRAPGRRRSRSSTTTRCWSASARPPSIRSTGTSCEACPYLVRPTAGWRKPKRNIPGIDVAGVVEAVGRNVTQFQPGDEVFGEKSRACAEYVCGAEKLFVAQAGQPDVRGGGGGPGGGATALQALRDKGQFKPGQQVLINGASGGVGTFAVQLAKAFGAEVTGVCSTPNVDLVRSLGADHVIDYTREDFTRSGRRYDLILDNAGNRSLWRLPARHDPGRDARGRRRAEGALDRDQWRGSSRRSCSHGSVAGSSCRILTDIDTGRPAVPEGPHRGRQCRRSSTGAIR